MKKFIDFIIKVLMSIVIFLAILLIAFIIYVYAFSNKTNDTFENTLSYFQAVGNEIINFKLTDKNLVNILLDNDTDLNTDIENERIVTSSNTKYYYDQLDNTSKIIYSSLENNIDNLKKENYIIDFSTKFNDLLHEASGQYELNKAFQSSLDAFFYDHPELFYIDLSKISLIIKCTTIGTFETYTVQIAPKDNKNYLYKSFDSEQEVNKAIAEVENIMDNFINTLSNENIYNNILKTHNMLINSIEYDSSFSKANAHNIYGSLVEKEVVCEGYAKAFKYILDSLNIECILVSGTATNSSNETESHMWNYVKLNGSWYGVDITWDDPIVIGGSLKNNLRYDYFLKGNSTFIKSHSPSGKISDTGMLFSMPSLSDKNYK